MKLTDIPAANRPGLLSDILETPSLLSRFVPAEAELFARETDRFGTLLLTGEGSSRIFPARLALAAARKRGDNTLTTAGAAEAAEGDLSQTAVIALSNSGRTDEVIRLGKKLNSENHPAFYGVTAAEGSLLGSLARRTHILSCGRERAVAATKSVAEQALFLGSVAALRGGYPIPDFKAIARLLESLLNSEVDPALPAALSGAETLYFAGRNDGTAEELSLKCNEILRKPSRYLEGTFLLHGVEEVMRPKDLLVVIDPFPGTEERIARILGDRTGIGILVIGPEPSRFPGIRHEQAGAYNPYLQLAAGWMLLCLAGIASGIDIDHPLRARKVGNDYTAAEEEAIRVLT